MQNANITKSYRYELYLCSASQKLVSRVAHSQRAMDLLQQAQQCDAILPIQSISVEKKNILVQHKCGVLPLWHTTMLRATCIYNPTILICEFANLLSRLLELHELKLYHHDLRLENIFVSDGKVLFGVPLVGGSAKKDLQQVGALLQACIEYCKYESFANCNLQDLSKQLLAGSLTLQGAIAELQKITSNYDPVKMMILGGDDSGRATLYKQFRLFGSLPAVESGKEHFKVTIALEEKAVQNILYNLVYICNAWLRYIENNHKKELENDVQLQDYKLLLPCEKLDSNIIKEKLRQSIDYVFQRCNQILHRRIHCMDAAQHGIWYLINHRARILADNYIPTTEDVLHLNAKTIGILESIIVHNTSRIKILTVGTSQNQKSKWINAFANIRAVLYCFSATDVIQYCGEDDSVDRYTEDMVLYDSVCNSSIWSLAPVILFITHCDVFVKEFENWRELYPDRMQMFANCASANEALLVLKEQIISKCSKKPIATYFCDPTQQKHMQRVIRQIVDLMHTNVAPAETNEWYFDAPLGIWKWTVQLRTSFCDCILVV